MAYDRSFMARQSDVINETQSLSSIHPQSLIVIVIITIIYSYINYNNTNLVRRVWLVIRAYVQFTCTLKFLIQLHLEEQQLLFSFGLFLPAKLENLCFCRASLDLLSEKSSNHQLFFACSSCQSIQYMCLQTAPLIRNCG